MGAYSRKQEKHIRAIDRRCRGPLYPLAAKLKAEALQAGDRARAARLNADFRGTIPAARTKAVKAQLGAVDELLERGEDGPARALFRKIATPCTQDVNDLVVAAEVPGLPLRVECPKCGTELGISPPVFTPDD